MVAPPGALCGGGELPRPQGDSIYLLQLNEFFTGKLYRKKMKLTKLESGTLLL